MVSFGTVVVVLVVVVMMGFDVVVGEVVLAVVAAVAVVFVFVVVATTFFEAEVDTELVSTVAATVVSRASVTTGGARLGVGDPRFGGAEHGGRRRQCTCRRPDR